MEKSKNPFSIVPLPKLTNYQNKSNTIKFEKINIKLDDHKRFEKLVLLGGNSNKLAVALFGFNIFLRNLEKAVGNIKESCIDLHVNFKDLKKSGAYNLDVKREEIIVEIPPEDLTSLQYALTTILQLLQLCDETHLKLPVCKIIDQPYARYRGLMIDVARKKHKLKDLKKILIICVWYKLNYLHIHFSDDQAYTLPSKTFPDLPSKRQHFSLKEIKELNDYAQNFNITIVPEVDVPGHARTLTKVLPNILGVQGDDWRGSTINMGNPESYDVVDKIIGEICEMFPSSPIIHMGADEVKTDVLNDDPMVKQYLEENRITNTQELYRHFIAFMRKSVQSRGRRFAVWEGFGPPGKIQIPKDTLIYEFECTFNPPDNVLKEGYRLVNTSWKPIYITTRKHWSVRKIYSWNMFRWENHADHSPATKKPFQFEPTDQIIGAQMCSWAQKPRAQVRSIKRRAAAFSEKIWNEKLAIQKHGTISRKQYDLFFQRLESTDQKLGKILKHCFKTRWWELRKENVTWKDRNPIEPESSKR